MEQQTIQKFPFKILGGATDRTAASADSFRSIIYKAAPGINQPTNIVDAKPSEPPKEPVYSEKQLLETRQKAYEEGYAKGYNGAKSDEAEVEKIIQVTLGEITLKLAAIGEAVKTRNNEHIKELAELIIRVARKVAGTALRKEPYAEIEHVIKASLPLLFDEPSVSITVSNDLVANIAGRITSLARSEGFLNNIEISGSNSLSLGSCNIEWNGGGIRSNKDGIWEQIESVMRGVRE